jgi:hypothetical protein
MKGERCKKFRVKNQEPGKEGVKSKESGNKKPHNTNLAPRTSSSPTFQIPF